MKHESTYRWLAADDLLRHALAAYYKACRDEDAYRAAAPEDAEINRPDFAEAVAVEIGKRLMAHGRQLALPGFADYSGNLTCSSFCPDPVPNPSAGAPVAQHPTSGTDRHIHCASISITQRGRAMAAPVAPSTSKHQLEKPVPNS
ncbi:MAG: hypothetical protein KIT17_12465 [Rubrivivax sp.]|nr:hypothetical protein [Rubrivivax sp.]